MVTYSDQLEQPASPGLHTRYTAHAWSPTLPSWSYLPLLGYTQGKQQLHGHLLWPAGATCPSWATHKVYSSCMVTYSDQLELPAPPGLHTRYTAPVWSLTLTSWSYSYLPLLGYTQGKQQMHGHLLWPVGATCPSWATHKVYSTCMVSYSDQLELQLPAPPGLHTR
jgi:hypothetical protein